MKRVIYSAKNSYKILAPEDIEYFNKATKQGRNFTACKKLGNKYIKDEDMFEWFISEIEGRLLTAEELDDLIDEELEEEYVNNISDDDDDDLDKPLPAEISAEIDRIHSTYPQLEVTIVIEDGFYGDEGDTIHIYNSDKNSIEIEHLGDTIDDVSIKKFKSALKKCVNKALS